MVAAGQLTGDALTRIDDLHADIVNAQPD